MRLSHGRDPSKGGNIVNRILSRAFTARIGGTALALVLAGCASDTPVSNPQAAANAGRLAGKIEQRTDGLTGAAPAVRVQTGDQVRETITVPSSDGAGKRVFTVVRTVRSAEHGRQAAAPVVTDVRAESLDANGNNILMLNLGEGVVQDRPHAWGADMTPGAGGISSLSYVVDPTTSPGFQLNRGELGNLSASLGAMLDHAENGVPVSQDHLVTADQ